MDVETCLQAPIMWKSLTDHHTFRMHKQVNTLVGSHLNFPRVLLHSLIACLQISENHSLLKCFGTAKVLGSISMLCPYIYLGVAAHDTSTRSEKEKKNSINF